MATKEELKQRMVTGHVITQQDMHDIIDVAGSKGAPGNPGKPGDDGFGTEAQYNEIISRLNELESPEE